MTDIVGIIGYPLGHSISPIFQQAAFDFYRMDARYLLWETRPDDLQRQMKSIRANHILGAGVTVPHKQAVIPYLDKLVGVAQHTGAVNTIINRDGFLEGHNTDVVGFLKGLTGYGDFNPAGKSVLILGAGGAARAVAYALACAEVKCLYIANRTIDTAKKLADLVTVNMGVDVLYSDFSALNKEGDWDLIVNCTTLGMRHGSGEGMSPLPRDLIPIHSLVYDLVYNPESTPLLEDASAVGARILGGLPMLVHQGAAAFQLWADREPPVEAMFEAAKKALRRADILQD